MSRGLSIPKNCERLLSILMELAASPRFWKVRAFSTLVHDLMAFAFKGFDQKITPQFPISRTK